MALTIPSALPVRSSYRSLAVRRWAVRLAIAILLAISALLAFGALSAAAPTGYTTSHAVTAGVGIKPLCQATMSGC